MQSFSQFMENEARFNARNRQIEAQRFPLIKELLNQWGYAGFSDEMLVQALEDPMVKAEFNPKSPQADAEAKAKKVVTVLQRMMMQQKYSQPQA